MNPEKRILYESAVSEDLVPVGYSERSRTDQTDLVYLFIKEHPNKTRDMAETWRSMVRDHAHEGLMDVPMDRVEMRKWAEETGVTLPDWDKLLFSREIANAIDAGVRVKQITIEEVSADRAANTSKPGREEAFARREEAKAQKIADSLKSQQGEEASETDMGTMATEQEGEEDFSPESLV